MAFQSAETLGLAELVEFRAPGFHVRLMSDRGDETVEICPALSAGDWQPLEWTLHAVGATGELELQLMTPAEAAAHIEQHYEALESGLSGARLEDTCEVLARLKADADRRVDEEYGL